jgi:hypothetical protein
MFSQAVDLKSLIQRLLYNVLQKTSGMLAELSGVRMMTMWHERKEMIASIACGDRAGRSGLSHDFILDTAAHGSACLKIDSRIEPTLVHAQISKDLGHTIKRQLGSSRGVYE